MQPTERQSDHKQIPHVIAGLTKSSSPFEIWREHAMGAEANLVKLDAIPEFLQAISRTLMLQGNRQNSRQWSVSTICLSFVLSGPSAQTSRFLSLTISVQLSFAK
jgi:hypothetical protein